MKEAGYPSRKKAKCIQSLLNSANCLLTSFMCGSFLIQQIASLSEVEV